MDWTTCVVFSASRPLRHLLRLPLALGVAFLLAAVSARDVGPTHLKLIVGVTDDTAKWMARQDGVVGVHRDLRLMAVRVTIPWRGQIRPTRLQQVYLHRISRMIQLNDRIVLSVYNFARHAPVTAQGRNRYCSFLHGVLHRIPLIHDVQIWNEVNSPVFWPQDAGADAYEALLARCWDRLHGGHAAVNVISSTAPRHDPGAFILRLGAVYRVSGRTRPLVDTFGHNPYPQDSSEPPSARHADSTFIGEGDYDRLMTLLQTAFAGTAQPVPGVPGVGIWYLE